MTLAGFETLLALKPVSTCGLGHYLTVNLDRLSFFRVIRSPLISASFWAGDHDHFLSWISRFLAERSVEYVSPSTHLRSLRAIRLALVCARWAFTLRMAARSVVMSETLAESNGDPNMFELETSF